MSRSIDERIVEMQFDNGQFEKGAQQTLNTLDKLKQALRFEDTASGLNQLGTAVNGVDMSGLAKGVEVVREKFSSLEVMAITALANITNRAVNAGTALVKSLSIDQVSAGYAKYEQEIEAVQTMMAATGLSSKEVTDSLAKITWFTDETSYKYSDMVGTMAKFTSAGVTDLEEASNAMMGIANWAAVSGISAQRATGAFYNLAQALSAGSVKMQDWRSIELLNMNTPQFRQNVIDIAIAEGKLKKVGDDLYQTLNNHKFTLNTFGSYLSDGWFTKEVLVKTLNLYGQYANEVYKVADAYDTCSEAMEHVSTEGMELGAEAFRAGQVARTLSDSITSIKDAVSTGWMETFRYIVGDYEESVKLWTNVANEMWNIFASGGAARNEALKEWHDLGGRDILLETLGKVYEMVKIVIGPIHEVFRDIFPRKTGKQLLEITENFSAFISNLRSSNKALHDFSIDIKDTFGGLFAALDILKKLATDILTEVIKPILKSILDIAGFVGGKLLDVTSSIGRAVMKFNDSYMTVAESLRRVKGPLEEIDKATKNTVDRLTNNRKVVSRFFDSLKKIEDLQTPLKNITNEADKLSSSARDIYNAVNKGNWLDKTKKQIDDVNKLIGDAKTEVKGLSDTSKDVITNIVRPFGVVNGVAKGVIDDLSKNKESIRSLFDVFKRIDEITTPVKAIGDEIGKISKTVNETADSAKKVISDVSKNINDGIGKAKIAIAPMKSLVEDVSKHINNASEQVKTFGDNAKNTINTITEPFKAVRDELDKINTATEELSEIPGKALKPFSDLADGMAKNIAKPAKALQDISDVMKHTVDLVTEPAKRLNSEVEKLTPAMATMSENIKRNVLWPFRDGAGVVENFVTVIVLAFEGIKRAFELLVSGAEKFAEGFQNGFGKVEGSLTIFEHAANLLGKLVNFIGKAVGFAFKGLGIGFSILSEGLSAALSGSDVLGENLSNFVNILNSGLVLSIFNTFRNALSDVKFSLKDVKWILEEVYEATYWVAEEIKADVFAKFGKALLMMAAGLFLISIINPERLTAALVGMYVLMRVIMDAMMRLSALVGALSTLVKDKTSLSIALFGLSYMITSVATALMIMAVAAKILSSISIDRMVWSVIAIGGMLLMLTVAMEHMVKAIGKNGANFAKGMKSVTKMASAILILAVAVKLLGSMDTKQVIVGTLAIMTLMGAFAVFAEYVQTDKKSAKAMSKVGSALKKFATAMIGIAVAVKIFSTIPTEQLIISLLTIGSVLLGMAAFTKMVDGSKVLGASFGMLLVANAMLIIAGAMKIISTNSWEDISKNLVVMGAGLMILAFATSAMKAKGMIKGAAAILILAGALMVLAPALAIIGGFSWTSIGKIFATLAISMGMLTVATLMMKGSELTILSVAAAMFLFGAGVFALGSGLVALGAGLSSIGASLPIFVAGIVGAIDAIIIGIGSSIGALAIGLAAILQGLIQAIRMVIPDLIIVVGEILVAVATALNQYGPVVLVELMDLLIKAAALFIMYMPVLVNLAVEALRVLAVAIRANSGPILAAVVDIGAMIISVLMDLLAVVFGSLPVVGDFLAWGLEDVKGKLVEQADAISAELDAQGSEAMSAYAEGAHSNIGEISGFSTEIANQFLTDMGTQADVFGQAGAFSLGQYLDQLGDPLGLSTQTGTELGMDSAGAIKETSDEFGFAAVDCVNGFANGVYDHKETAIEAARVMAREAAAAARAEFQIASPSKVFAEMGRYSVLGLAKGFTDNTVLATDASSNMARSVINTMKDSIARITDIIDTDMNITPTITPVMDLDNIKTGAANIGRYLNHRGFSIGSTLATAGSVSRLMDNSYAKDGNDIPKTPASVSFVQNNYSPKALSRIDIYRQTKNQFSAVKEVLNK